MIVVPRRLAWGLGFLLLLLVVWRIQQPPVVLLQRLDSPDQRYRAFLQRTKHTRDHLQVRLSGLGPSFIAYVSPPYRHDFRVDLGERLSWSPSGEELTLQIEGKPVWRYHVGERRGIDLDRNDAW